VRKPAAVEPEAQSLASSNGNSALHDEDRPFGQLRQLVQHPLDRGEIRLPRVSRGRRHADEGDPGQREDLLRVECEAEAVAVAVDELRETRLVDREAARLELSDPLRRHVAHDHVMA
jgi:hypothetical protein